jgi:hypothetical protein
MNKEVDQAKALALTAELYAQKAEESETRWGWYSEANAERSKLREENVALKSELENTQAELKKVKDALETRTENSEDAACKSSE